MSSVTYMIASLALALVTQDRIVVASDSRTWDATLGKAAGDVARKVDVRGNTAFWMTGCPLIYQTWQTLPVSSVQSAREIGKSLLDAANPSVPEVCRFTFGVARFAAPVDTYMAVVDLHPDGRVVVERSVGDISVPFVTTAGWDDGGAKRDTELTRLQAFLRTSPSEAQMVAEAKGLLAKAAEQSPKVGGPSHVAVLDAKGSRWLTRYHWDGTDLKVQSGALKIDSNGIYITPGLGTWLETDKGFAFDVGSNVLGTYGYTGGGIQSLLAQSWAASTPTQLHQWVGYGGSSSSPTNYANIVMAATPSAANIVMTTNLGGTPNAGIIALGGTVNFQTAGTSGSAGSLAGYLVIQVNGATAKIPVYNP